MVDLSTTFCGIPFSNPTVLASGILGLSAETMLRVVTNGAGGITTKGLGLEKRAGHTNPTVLETEHYLFNAVGLSNPGIDTYVQEIKQFKVQTAVPLLANIFASEIDAWQRLAEKVATTSVDALELNVSCPHTDPKEGIGMTIGQHPQLVEKITRVVKKAVKIPVIVKLSPNVNDIVVIARAAEAGGADALSAINTVGPGMAIDIETATPVLGNKVGGLSGPGIKPIAIADVYKIFQAVKIPIIGMGGIITGKDAIEIIMAGATLVGIGSAVCYRGMEVFGKVCQEMAAWMQAHGYTKVEELIGLAHKK